ncbi:MAG: TldD/PmbA family protein [Vicinamibacteraceae bacterium]|nr:TldD/PmbA family protein [Vicinamibacteraceae bacterium]
MTAGALALGAGQYLHLPGVAAAPLARRDPKFREWGSEAIKTARRLGCSYCDIRFTRNRNQAVVVRNGQLGSGGFQSYGGFGGGDGAIVETYGFGVRVLHGGVWGFASSPIVTPDEITRVVGRAADVAKASAVAKKFDVTLAPVPAYDDVWQTPIERDPFEVPLEEKIAMLAEVSLALKKNPGVLFGSAQAGFKHEWKFLATSEGSFIEQDLRYATCRCSATARHQGQVKTRTYSPSSASRGYEFVVNARLADHAERVAAEAVEHAMAKPVGSGLKDLVLLPSHLQLTIHEIIAHPTELDRVVGYEANYAGTSFITLKDVGRLKYGSPLFNVVADRTYPGAMATVGYDDDGVKSQKWQIVKDGILVGLQTNRETAHYMGETESRGCTFANHWRNFPFLRMPNVQLEPGPPGSPTLEQMIGSVKDGVLVDGTGSFSIDQQRYNGQFGGDAFWEIRNGKVTRMVTDFTYNAITTDFWANLEAVGPPEAWEHHGMDGDAKGQPVQSNWPSHGSSPCLVRRVMVGTAFA